jgi:hypothetical protein
MTNAYLPTLATSPAGYYENPSVSSLLDCFRDVPASLGNGAITFVMVTGTTSGEFANFDLALKTLIFDSAFGWVMGELAMSLRGESQYTEFWSQRKMRPATMRVVGVGRFPVRQLEED